MGAPGQQRLFGRTPLSPSERAGRERLPALATEGWERLEVALEAMVPAGYVPGIPPTPAPPRPAVQQRTMRQRYADAAFSMEMMDRWVAAGNRPEDY